MIKTIKKFIVNSLKNDDQTIDKNTINIIFKPIIAILFFLMILITFAQVIFRYILNSALPWAGEITIFFFIWIIFLGAAITLHKELHIGVDIFTNFLNKKYKKLILIFTNILIVIFCVLIIAGSIPLIIDNYTQRSPALEIRLTFIYASIPISMLAMIFIIINKLLRIIKD
jgi:TRAP-type C4-dicarboxylate transport system permease small subunit